jgi:hypothetical protein
MIPVASIAGIRSGHQKLSKATRKDYLAAYDYLRSPTTQPDLCSDGYPHHKMRVTRVVALTPKTSVNLAV